MPTNRAAVITAEKADLVVQDNPYPTPSATQVTIKVESAGFNPVDAKLQKYAIWPIPYPGVLGSDVAGTVVEVGKDVTRLAVGDRVGSIGSGAYQQYIAVEAKETFKIGDLSFDAAASVGAPFLTAAAGLSLWLKVPRPAAATHTGNTSRGTLLIPGGATGVGMYTLQYAAAAGYAVVTTSSPHNAALLRTLGATTVIDYHSATAAAEIKAAGPYVGTFDAVGSSPALLAQVGIDVVGSTIYSTLPDMEGALTGKAEIVFRSFPTDARSDPDFSQWVFAFIEKELINGNLKTLKTEVRPGGLGGVQTLFDDYLEKGVSAVKLVVHPWE